VSTPSRLSAQRAIQPDHPQQKRIAIVGAGRVGGALAGGWVKAGHSITLGARDPSGDKVKALLHELGAALATTIAQAVAQSEIVALATPWDGAQATVQAAGDLAGKVLIDCTNPIGAGGLALGHTTSGAEQIAQWAPGARVVKAFNTIGFEVMANTDFAGGKPALFLCGDDAEARQTVAGLAADLGFEPVDCGPLRLARSLEPLAALWVSLARSGLGRQFAWALLRR
jgi:predicted dinucleotide-binding enzyme